MLRGAHPEKAQTVLKKNGKDGKSILHKQVHKGEKVTARKTNRKAPSDTTWTSSLFCPSPERITASPGQLLSAAMRRAETPPTEMAHFIPGSNPKGSF